MIGTEEPQILHVPIIDNSRKLKLKIGKKKQSNIYSKLEEPAETKNLKLTNCKTCDNNKEIGKCAKPKSNIECAFEGLPENVCDSIEVSFDDLKDCNSLPNDTFSDIPTNTFEDIEIAVQEN